MFKNLKPAGVLALVVIGLLLLSSLGLLGRAVLQDRPQVMPPAVAAAPTAAPTPTDTVPPTPPLDTDAAWETFMQAIYRADAIPDYGSDLSLYPASKEALSAGLTDVTTDTVWIGWGTDVNPDCAASGTQCWIRRLAEFGPRQITCTGNVCEASVSVTSIGIYGFWATAAGAESHLHRQADHPEWRPAVPLRLLIGTVEYRPTTERWVVTRMTVTILPEPPEYTTQ